MKDEGGEIAPLIKSYILIDEIESQKNINNSLYELKKMCKMYGDELIKNANLISFNHTDFKNVGTKEKEIESFFTLNFLEFIENENFVDIFTELLMDAKQDNEINEIYNGLNKKFNLNIEHQIKLILSFIGSGIEKYNEDANLLFLEKCKEIYEQKIFSQIKNNSIIEKIINVLFNILKIKNRQENNKENNIEQNNIDEENIKLFIQSFSHYNEQLKNSRNYKDKVFDKSLKNEEIDKIESNFNINDTKRVIEIEKLIYELGPFMVNQKINLLNFPYINTNLDLKRLNEFIIYILNNKEIKITKELKYLNKKFLEAMNSDKEIINKLDSLPINQIITWDLDFIYFLFKNNFDNIDKKKLLISFDSLSFKVDNKAKFDFFCEILTKFHFFGDYNNNNIYNISDIQVFFDNFIFIKWKNVSNQIKFLELLITDKEISENSIFSLKNYLGQKTKKDIELKAYISSKNHFLIENWRNVKLVETLLLISEGDNYAPVRNIFDWALKNIPEIIVMSLLVIKVDYNENILMKELVLEILTSILNDKSPRLNFIDEIWQTNKDIVIFTLYKSWEKNPDLMNLSLIFDLANTELKDSLLPLVNSKYHNFSVHLGLLASKRDYLHIEQWLKKSIEKYGDNFICSLLDYLKINIIQPCQNNLNPNENNKASTLEKAQLSLESLSIILNTLNSYNIQNENDNSNNDKISPKTKKEIGEIYKTIFDIYDEIQDQQINPEEIQKEVSQLLRSMFQEKTAIDTIINMLSKYKSSNNKRQNELFSCLIHGILDEYRFYNQYPQNKLKKISELFGKILNNKLLDGIIETLALKYILKGIKTGSGSLYFFGINALTQFIGKISHWPTYMKTLLDLEQIKQNKKIYLLLQQENEKFSKKSISEKSADTVDKLIPSISISHTQSENKSIEENSNKNINNENVCYTNKSFKSKESKDSKEKENVNKLKNKLTGVTKSYIDNDYQNNDENKIEMPMDEVINKTKVIFETLNKSNIFEKSLEIKKLLGEDEKLIRWFSYYFMTTKINHWKNIPFRVFNELFKEINNPKLSKYILKDTINYIQELLSLDCLYIDDKCKNLLKNLGTWLGFNTLSKNKPIWAKDIDFKELISNSYKKGELNTIIPFTCRVFSFISKTKIFNVNNPWINSILCLLKEIYSKSALCLTLKEEIRNFFENVKVDMNSISNSTKVLNKIVRLDSKNHDFPDSQKYQINIDLNELTKKISSLNDYINNLLNILINDKNKVRGFYYNNSYNDYNNLNENDNPNNSSNPNYKIIEHQKKIISILANIMYQSILDAIPDLITLFVHNPINSAVAIVNKDFTFESDLNKYQTALDNILQSILKSFSIIGSHDKLKSNIDSNFEKYYKAKQLEKETINKIKELPNSEYINIGLEYIQNFIMNEARCRLNLNKKVLEEIDKRRHGNLNLSENDFYGIYITKIKKKMPDILKPNELCIKDNEYKVYENFKMNGYKFYEEDSDKSSFLNIVYRILKEVIDKADPGQNKVSIYKNYDLCMKNIQNISKKNSFNNNNFDEDQQLLCLKKIIVNSKINQIDICSHLALNTFKYIIDSIKINNLLLLNVYLHILRGWVKLNNEIVDKITIFLFEYDVDIFTKFKYELHLNLMKQKFINNNIYENYIIKLFTESSIINVIIQKLSNDLINNNGNSPKSPFNQIKSYYYDKNSEKFYLLFNEKSRILNSLINNSKHINDINNQIDEDDGDKSQIEFKNIRYFVNIIQEFYKSYYSSEKIFDKNVQILYSDQILKCTELLCELCLNNINNGRYNKYFNYYYPENFAIFIYYIICNDQNNNIELYNNILEKIVNYFHQDYIKNQLNFNQKKYHKFFINLISLIINNTNKKGEKKTNNLKDEYMLLICDILKLLSPMNYQGFIMAWLDLISYNDFIEYFLDDSLSEDNKDKYKKYLSLLTDLLSYLNFIKNQSINHYYYKVILDNIYKLFYYLANTYQAFIHTYQFILFSYLSLSSNVEDEDNNYFLQLKNIILSSIPQSLSTGKKVNKTLNENFPNITLFIENSISYQVICLLLEEKDITDEMKLNKMMEKYIIEKGGENTLEQILTYLSNIKDERELIEIYNGLMLHWCYKRNNCINGKEIKEKKLFYNFYYFLLCNLDETHKKYLIDSILNSLRFSCEQTISCSILFVELFINLENEDIERQLMVNILERALYQPIPWGVKYTLNCLFDDERFQKMEKKYIDQNIEIVNFIKCISDNKKKK